MLKTLATHFSSILEAYHLGEGRVLKTHFLEDIWVKVAYHLGEGRVLKTTS